MEANFVAVITAIPNQPVNFSGSYLRGCDCGEIQPPTLFDPENDTLRFQVLFDLCAGAENLMPNPDFIGANWKTGIGWTISSGRACGSGLANSTLTESSFVPSVGTEYMVRVTVSNLVAPVSVSFGGYTLPISQEGTTTYNITTVAASGIVITLGADTSEVCLRLIEVFEVTRPYTVELVAPDDTVLATYAPDTDPDAFTFDGTHMVFSHAPFDDSITGCFSVRVTEECPEGDTVLTSQQFVAVPDHECSLVVTVCNDNDAIGFASYPFELRIPAKMVRPSWEYEVSEERQSNGRWLRSYADAQRKMELHIMRQSEDVHSFLSLLPLFSHLYIGQEEYWMDAEGYEPAYQDVWIASAPIVLTLRPKEELLRNVMCAKEGSGCPPPPNLLVQGTGPNMDYIVTNAGERILLS